MAMLVQCLTPDTAAFSPNAVQTTVADASRMPHVSVGRLDDVSQLLEIAATLCRARNIGKEMPIQTNRSPGAAQLRAHRW